MSQCLWCRGQWNISSRQHRETFNLRRLPPRSIQKSVQRLEQKKGFTVSVAAAFNSYAYNNASSVKNAKGFDNDIQESRRIRRVVLKISGEALGGDRACGIDHRMMMSVAEQIATCNMDGIQIIVVVGGGNFFRGADAFPGIDRVTADYVGMLATTMNGACLHSMLENLGIQARLQTAIEMREIAEPYIRRNAIEQLENGCVVICTAGTGSPFFTTDMAAVIRAAELNADEVLKATKVDGIYSEDPLKNKQAKRLDWLTYEQAMDNEIGVMDRSALLFCGEQSIPIRVFSLTHPKHIEAAIRGVPTVGSVIQNGDDSRAIHSNYLKMENTHPKEKNDVSDWKTLTNELIPNAPFPVL